MAKSELARRVAEALAAVDLAGFETRRISELSGGQQQRVAIARTLAIAPRVLLLDEPLSNLDAKLRASTGLELKRLQRRLGVTTVFVTHDQQEAMTIADRIAVLDRGVIQQAGTPRELYDAPVNRFVAEFVGSINLFRGRASRAEGELRHVEVEGLGAGSVRAARTDARLPPCDTPALVAFRPHAVRLAQGVDGDGLAFDAEVAVVEFLGEFVRYGLRAGNHEISADLPHARHQDALAVGHRARFAVPAAEILVLAVN